MRASEFLDALLDSRGADTEQLLQELAAMSPAEQVAIREETLRQLFSGDMFFPGAMIILSRIGLEPAVPELVRLLRTRDAKIESRAAAFMLLRQTDAELGRELESLDGESGLAIMGEVVSFERALETAVQKGTPFEVLADFDPDDEDEDEDDGEELAEAVIDDLMQSFLASSEAASDADRDQVAFWVRELLSAGLVHGFGSPVFWGVEAVEEIVITLVPLGLSVESEVDLDLAVPAFRSFFRWTASVVPLREAAEIDDFLEQLESTYPSIVIDSLSPGMSGSFAMQSPAARKKADAAKKRKAKMAKLSRRKNRRKK